MAWPSLRARALSGFCAYAVSIVVTVLSAGPADADSVSITDGVTSAPFSILLGTAAPDEAIRVRDGERWICPCAGAADPVIDSDDRVVEGASGRGLNAVVEWSPEIDHDLARSRCGGPATVVRWRPAVAAVSDPEAAAHRPLTFPLRP